MKFALLTAIAAGAALVQVGASPIRVVVVTSTNQEFPSPFRFGHAVPQPNANPTNPNVAMLVRPAVQANHRGSCRGSRMRQKAIDMSNAFRKALGWPLIEATERPHRHHHHVRPTGSDSDRVHILPFVGTMTNTFVEEGRVRPHPDAVPNPYIAHPRPHHGGLQQRLRNSSTLQRVHVALMVLGPWEGRAVAFVLGCGIGVLLRMFWVLAIVSYRLIKGPKEDENKYTEIFVVEEYEDAATAAGPAPPTYTYSDEKADKKDGEAVAAAN
ncbi:hypothetical protein FPV67DRAFT_1623316 [Lyophyllum atratum]|nr:hypothetical protein FPV67DRAFT_1623316 [Lyophyllum atratum]